MIDRIVWRFEPSRVVLFGSQAWGTANDLVAFYNVTDGSNWNNNRNWLSGNPMDEWYGVATNDVGRVTVLELYGNSLRGEIPTELGSLSDLMGLPLYGNGLTGGFHLSWVACPTWSGWFLTATS